MSTHLPRHWRLPARSGSHSRAICSSVGGPCHARGVLATRRRHLLERLHLKWLRPRRRGFVRPRRSLVAWRSPCRTRILRCHRVQAHSGSSPARFLTRSSQPRSNLRPLEALLLGMLHASPSRSTLWTPSHRLLPKPSRSPLLLRESGIQKAVEGDGGPLLEWEVALIIQILTTSRQ